MTTTDQRNGFPAKAYQGDARTLLAFELVKAKARNLAGFTIQASPEGKEPYFLFNTLRFEKPEGHTQVTSESPNSSVNAPIHKFRWVHIPGSVHQGTKPFFGPYTYTVTPRYFDGRGSLQPLDARLSVKFSDPQHRQADQARRISEVKREFNKRIRLGRRAIERFVRRRLLPERFWKPARPT